MIFFLKPANEQKIDGGGENETEEKRKERGKKRNRFLRNVELLTRKQKFLARFWENATARRDEPSPEGTTALRVLANPEEIIPT